MKKSTKVFKVSDPSKNVYGFAVDTKGIETENFLLNPVMLLNHNYDKMMGLWADLSVSGESMTAIPVFDEVDTEAVNMASKVEQDILKGASIGIIPLSVKDGVITKSDLLEISLTPVPANRSALVLYNTKGVALSVKEAAAYCLSIENSKKEKTNSMNKELLAALVMLCAQAGLTVQLNADAKDEDIEKAITGVNNKVIALKLSNVELTATNEAFKTKAALELKATGEALVNAAIEAKKITADKKETFLKLYAADADLCKSTLDALATVNLTAIPGADKAKEEAAKGREDWTFEKWLKEDSMGLSAMQTNEVEKFQKLFDAYSVNLKANGSIA